ncbi:glycosyltransferase family protein [Saccharicrinis aurantiacus]|uniref:hypothetical protein n=1 Tax=Saccharicrinis aurantiacus TaxID=1849719 RepID=UPI00094FA6A5|nr:hypothetical protein [Saccharicrinis aurantiacus]
MSKLAILHYLPLEYYPPITNLIDYIAKEQINNFTKVRINSTHNIKGRKEYKANKNSTLNIKRSPLPKVGDKSFIRLFKYLHFNLVTIIGLIINRPNCLLYYESYSAWPAYVYTKYFNRNCKLFIHFHEYASQKWYATTMRQVKYFHQLEINWLFSRATWISQTNTDRLAFFHRDHPNLKKEQLKTMPNYPPRSWSTILKGRHLKSTKKPIKLVYVGALSFQSTYLKELCNWVLKQNGMVQFDVYAYNLYEDVKRYLQDIDSTWVNYYEQGIEYQKQPKILQQYDVGLILYKAHNRNYTYNAPNKLFEYIACNLDVWYPAVLQGPKPYNTKETYPKVVPVNFEDLNNFDWQTTIDKTGCTYKSSEYYCEEVYEEMVNAILTTNP